MDFLDRWWLRQTDNPRYDHGPMYVSMIIALWLSAISMLIVGPVPGSSISEISNGLQNYLSLQLFTGSSICLIGIFSGSKHFLPNFQRRKSYQLSIVGAPAISSSMIFYGVAVFNNVDNFPSALGAFLAPLLGLGTAVSGVCSLLEVRRISRNATSIIISEEDDDNSS